MPGPLDSCRQLAFRNHCDDPDGRDVLLGLVVPNNPLLKLNPEKIRLLRFGDTYVEYRVRAGTFKLSFPSREMMELGVAEWLTEASKRGQFFRLDVMKSLCPQRMRRRRARPLK